MEDNLITTGEWLKLRKVVLERDNYICTYCHNRKPRMCVDHIIPFIQGGSHQLDNLATACPNCNASKGRRTPEQWKRGEKITINRVGCRFRRPPNKSFEIGELKSILEIILTQTTIKEFCKEIPMTQADFKYWVQINRKERLVIYSSYRYNMIIKIYKKALRISKRADKKHVSDAIVELKEKNRKYKQALIEINNNAFDKSKEGASLQEATPFIEICKIAKKALEG